MASFDYLVEHTDKDLYRYCEIESSIIEEVDPECGLGYLLDEHMEFLQKIRDKKGKKRLAPEVPLPANKSIVRQRLVKDLRNLADNIEAEAEKGAR